MMTATSIRDELFQAGIHPDRPVRCEAYANRGGRLVVIGTWEVPFHQVAALDTITWRGWYLSNERLVKCGLAHYPDGRAGFGERISNFGFGADEQKDGIR